MMSSEIHIEDAAPLQAEGVAVDVYGWFNLHKLSMCLAAAYAAYYLLVIVRVRPVFCVKSILVNISHGNSCDGPTLHRRFSSFRPWLLPSVAAISNIRFTVRVTLQKLAWINLLYQLLGEIAIVDAAE